MSNINTTTSDFMALIELVAGPGPYTPANDPPPASYFNPYSPDPNGAWAGQGQEAGQGQGTWAGPYFNPYSSATVGTTGAVITPTIEDEVMAGVRTGARAGGTGVPEPGLLLLLTAAAVYARIRR